VFGFHRFVEFIQLLHWIFLHLIRVYFFQQLQIFPKAANFHLLRIDLISQSHLFAFDRISPLVFVYSAFLFLLGQLQLQTILFFLQFCKSLFF
jgi:hypothetical protein